MTETVRMCDLRFDSSLFENYLTGTVLDRLLCSYSGLPKASTIWLLSVLWNGTVASYFCRQKNGKSMPNRKILYVCSVFEDSVSYSVAVEKNRQILATGHTDRYVCYRRTLFSFSVLRGVWRCLFHLKGGRGALFSVWKMKEI